MKKFILLAQILFASNFSFGQITLEHYYPSVGGGIGDRTLFYTILSPCNFKYFQYNYGTNILTIYNIDHSIYTTINIPSQPPQVNEYLPEIYSVSNLIFDTDSNSIEYLLVGSETGNAYFTVYRNDGTVLLSDTNILNGSASLLEFIPNKSVINTPEGLKLLMYYPNGDAKVWSLPGQFPECYDIMGKVIYNDNNFSLSNPFPNPSSEFITVPYELPNGINSGEIIISNSQGQEIRKYKVDRTFNSLQLNVSAFSDGVYFYQLQTSQGIIGTKKIIKTK